MDSKNAGIESMISLKRSDIRVMKNAISRLINSKEKLEKHLLNCKVAKTTANSTNIIGTFLCFTPLFPLGIGMAISGSVTSAGTDAVEYYIVKGIKDEIVNILRTEEAEKAELMSGFIKVCKELKKAAEIILKIGSKALSTTTGAVKTAQDAKEIIDIVKWFKYYKSLEPTGTVAYNGIRGASYTKQILMNGSRAGKIFAVAGIGLSAADIALTWTMSNSTSNELKKLIEERRAEIAKVETEIEHIIRLRS